MPRRKDENEIAFDTLQQILRRDAKRDGLPQEPIPKPEKVPYRVKAGRKGGRRRATKLSTKQRKLIAKKAILTRWSKKK
jgi:hypothetical protein